MGHPSLIVLALSALIIVWLWGWRTGHRAALERMKHGPK